mmetsp:Transcript_46932/g.118913  ORF Transcript_46932/g.118913 Transcript_46932/m.118913 type:complete len:241 (+) Transcript_46932:537-1259(+)
MRFSQSPFRASTLLPRPCRKTVASSGAEGQVAVQAGGTSERIRNFASAMMSGVLRAVPPITFCMVVRELLILSPSLPASIESIKTKATTGGSSGVTLRTSMLFTLESCVLLTVSHNWNRGPNCAFQALMSTLPPPPPPSALPPAAASVRNIAMTFVELILCSDLSAFGAMPKDCGLSKSGSCSTRARKSAMRVDPGMSKGGIWIAELAFLRGPSNVSDLKNMPRYSLTNLESNSLSTRLP